MINYLISLTSVSHFYKTKILVSLRKSYEKLESVNICQVCHFTEPQFAHLQNGSENVYPIKL